MIDEKILINRHILLTYLLIDLFIVLVLSSCSAGTTGANDATVSETGESCETNTFSVIEKTEDQGNLVAWSTDARTLAYIGPSKTSYRHIGNLNLAKSPDYSESESIDERVVGGMIWAPDDESIAYTSLRASDNLYTITVYNLSTRRKTDLFPGDKAKTDEWSSPKRAVSWESNNALSIEAMCGPGCVETIRYDTGSDTYTVENQAIRNSLWAATEEPATDGVFPSSGQFSISIDEFGKVSLKSESTFKTKILNPTQAVRFFELTEPWTYEFQWAADQYLAVRINDELTLYDLSCVRDSMGK